MLARTSRMTLRTLILVSLVLVACADSAHAQVATKQPHELDRSIRAVDFQNYTYESQSGGYSDPRESITVTNGAYERPRSADGHDQGYFRARAPMYGDLNGDGVEDAIVVTLENGGGRGIFDAAHVFTMRNGQVAKIAEVPGGDRGFGGFRNVTLEPGGLKVERLTSVAGDGAHRASKLTIEHWRWIGKALAIDDKRTTIVDNPDAQRWK